MSNNQLEASAHISVWYFSSTKVPIHDSVELVKNNRLLYNIIESERNEAKVDKYLKNIEMTVDKFMEKNSLWVRKDLVGGLEDIARKKGTFAVGWLSSWGKSTGKSLVLRESSVQEENNKKVIMLICVLAMGVVYWFRFVIVYFLFLRFTRRNNNR
jgi:hypothetical protein